MSKEKGKNAAVQVAEEQEKEQNGMHTNANGIKFYIRAVPSLLIADVINKLEPVKIQTYVDKKTGQEVANPSHPKYIEDLEKHKIEKYTASTDAMILFGIELVDPVPADRRWLNQLVYLGILEQDELASLTDMDLEFYYKKYVVSDNETLKAVSEKTGITGESVQKARDEFPGNA